MVHNQSTTTASNPLSLCFNGLNSPQFALSNDLCTGQSLAAGATCAFQLTFTAPAGCNPGDLFHGPVQVILQTNGHPYIVLDAQGSCPTPP